MSGPGTGTRLLKREMLFRTGGRVVEVGVEVDDCTGVDVVRLMTERWVGPEVDGVKNGVSAAVVGDW